MKKIFTFLLSAMICTMVMGQTQAPEAVIKKATIAPVIDGEIDDVWDEAEPNLIDKPFKGETPSLGNSGDTWWKALWADNGIYILVNVKDDIWAPSYGATDAYKYDKIEIYFDTNFNHQDGKGPQTDANGGGNGHYQFAPDVVQDSISGGYASSRGGNGSTYSFNVADPDYFAEFFIPFTKLLDEGGGVVTKTEPIGFDVTISDNDIPAPGGVRTRAAWANVGNTAESWTNMDDCGTILLDGAEPGIDISDITITGPTEITTDNGTAQFSAVYAPADATQVYKWEITNGTGVATISNTGLVKAQRNGTVTVKAVSSDNYISSNEITLNLSGQRISLEEINLFKNGNFNKGTNNLESWGVNPAADWMVEDGWLTVTVAPKTNIYDVMSYQAVSVDATTKYIIKFKAKASVNMTVPFIIEDIAHEYKKDVTTSSAYRTGEFWSIPVTTEPEWYEFDVIHSSFVDKSVYQPSFQVGKLEGTLYVDSVMMYKESDWALVDLKADAKSIEAGSIKVYPNPVGNGKTLFVELKKINDKVAIYNAAGQKLTEKTADGYKATFDVSSLRQGLYFIKTNNGSVQKFVR